MHFGTWNEKKQKHDYNINSPVSDNVAQTPNCLVPNLRVRAAKQHCQCRNGVGFVFTFVECDELLPYRYRYRYRYPYRVRTRICKINKNNSQNKSTPTQRNTTSELETVTSEGISVASAWHTMHLELTAISMTRTGESQDEAVPC